MRTIANTESHTRWRIHSGILELSSAGSKAAGKAAGKKVAEQAAVATDDDDDDGFAVSVSGVALGWSPKRGDGPLRLQFPRVPLDAGHTVADRCARLKRKKKRPFLNV
eukprot:COSAG06_NODE_2301_length_7120_cov_3.535251_2_plen_108_part_00